jgi:hypothetical protein
MELVAFISPPHISVCLRKIFYSLLIYTSQGYICLQIFLWVFWYLWQALKPIYFWAISPFKCLKHHLISLHTQRYFFSTFDFIPWDLYLSRQFINTLCYLLHPPGFITATTKKQEWFLSFFFFLFGLSAWHVGSYFPKQGGLEPSPLQWGHGVLTTGLPEKSSAGGILMFSSSRCFSMTKWRMRGSVCTA